MWQNRKVYENIRQNITSPKLKYKSLSLNRGNIYKTDTPKYRFRKDGWYIVIHEVLFLFVHITQVTGSLLPELKDYSLMCVVLYLRLL